jgi:hypothetical protein
MQCRAVILPDGKLSLFISEGTYAEGKVKLEQLLATLKASGLEFDQVGIVEQHRHDDEHVHVHANGEVHSHSH